MREKGFFEEKGRELVGGIGVLLLLLAIGIGFWVVGIVDQALHHPNELPLLQPLASLSSSESEFQFLENQGSVTANFPGGILLIVLIGFLLGSIGSIVGALISGGVKLVGMAAGLLPREAEKKGTGG